MKRFKSMWTSKHSAVDINSFRCEHCQVKMPSGCPQKFLLLLQNAKWLPSKVPSITSKCQVVALKSSFYYSKMPSGGPQKLFLLLGSFKMPSGGLQKPLYYLDHFKMPSGGLQNAKWRSSKCQVAVFKSFWCYLYLLKTPSCGL